MHDELLVHHRLVLTCATIRARPTNRAQRQHSSPKSVAGIHENEALQNNPRNKRQSIGASATHTIQAIFLPIALYPSASKDTNGS